MSLIIEDTERLNKLANSINKQIGKTEPLTIDKMITSIEKIDNLNVLKNRSSFDYLFFAYQADKLPEVTLDMSKVVSHDYTSMDGEVFDLCCFSSIKSYNGEIKFINGSPTRLDEMFLGCEKLTTVKNLDLSHVNSLDYTFRNCKSLITIERINVLNCQNFREAFGGCINLQNISFEPECITSSISFKDSKRLSSESIQSIIDGLCHLTQKKTITFATEITLTDSQIAEVTHKGWTIVK